MSASVLVSNRKCSEFIRRFTVRWYGKRWNIHWFLQIFSVCINLSWTSAFFAGTKHQTKRTIYIVRGIWIWHCRQRTTQILFSNRPFWIDWYRGKYLKHNRNWKERLNVSLIQISWNCIFQVSVENILNAGSQLQFILQKQNPKIWWSRLTAQPQKQNWIHVSQWPIISTINDPLQIQNSIHLLLL